MNKQSYRHFGTKPWSVVKAAFAVSAMTAVSFAAPAVGEKPTLGMLNDLDRGRWELREHGNGADVTRMCLGDARRLIQLRHPGDNCQRLIVTDSSSEVTVQYTCPGRGYGRTHIRRETNSLIQMDIQGVANGLPFSSSFEGRKVGDCQG